MAATTVNISDGMSQAISTLANAATTVLMDVTTIIATDTVETTSDLTTDLPLVSSDVPTGPGFLNYSGNSTNSTETLPALEEWRVKLAKANEWTMTITLVIVMLGMGATMTLKELWSNIRRPYGIIIGAVSQFLVMPLCGFAMAHATNMSPTYAIGTLIICCCPGGTLSNIFCYWSDGDVVLSICMTSISTLLAVGMMPLCLFIYSRSWTDPGGAVIPYANIMLSLVAVVVPAAVGCFCKYKFPKAAKYITQVASVFGVIGIVAALVFVILLNPNMFNSGWQAWVAAATLPVWGFCFGYILSSIFRLKHAKRRTVAFETGCQNVALALTIIGLSYPRGPEQLLMMVVPSLFGPFMSIDAIIFVIVYRCWKRFCSKSKGEKEEHDEKIVGEENGNIPSKDGINGIAAIRSDEVTLDEVKYRDAAVNTDETYTNFAFEHE
ncbi:ileal sodium/bile acid cotransporter-like isoform X2 [Ptychodera flava]